MAFGKRWEVKEWGRRTIYLTFNILLSLVNFPTRYIYYQILYNLYNIIKLKIIIKMNNIINLYNLYNSIKLKNNN